MTAIQRFYTWRETKLKENPDWSEETRDWFLGMYMQTYPARTPAIVTELFDFYEGAKVKELMALLCDKLTERINDDTTED